VLEDKLVYDEPPGWMHPVRHALGALLIADGKPATPWPSTRRTWRTTARTAGP
jgi:hypothetical protein